MYKIDFSCSGFKCEKFLNQLNSNNAAALPECTSDSLIHDPPFQQSRRATQDGREESPLAAAPQTAPASSVIDEVSACVGG